MGPRTAFGGFIVAATSAWLARRSSASPLASSESPVAWCETPVSTPPPPSSETPGFFFFKPPARVLSETVRSIVECSEFIDRHCLSAKTSESPDDENAHRWMVEATDFSSQRAVDDLVRRGAAVLQIMRLHEVYTPIPAKPASPGDGTKTDGERLPADGNAAPVMRLVGFFPGSSTNQVYEELVNVPKRFKWDTNYLMFEALPKQASSSSSPSSIEPLAPSPCYSLHDESVRRDFFASAPRISLCEGDVCKFLPNARSELLEQDWLCHKVGSTFLSRFGFVPRFFRYERVGFRHRLLDVSTKKEARGESSDPHAVGPMTAERLEEEKARIVEQAAVYDILYSGARQGVEEATARSDALKKFLSRAERTIHGRENNQQVEKGFVADGKAAADTSVVPVDVNYQHIVLIPIANYRQQLMQPATASGDGGGKPTGKDKWFSSASRGPMNRAFLQLANSGSMRDAVATKWVYAMLADTAGLALNSAAGKLQAVNDNGSDRNQSIANHEDAAPIGDEKSWGTLLVMTAANDANVPSGVPAFMQRKIASVLSHQAYGELTAALRNTPA